MRHIACLRARKRPAIALLAAIVLGVFLPTQAAPASAAGTAAQLNHLLQRFAREHPSFPGVALAVRTPKLTWAGAAGVADRTTRKPLSAKAGFRIASVTKTFTAAAILRLAENGKLSLDDPIALRLSPATVALLRGGGYDVDAIHVRNLLQHTSGLFDYAADPAFQAFVVRHPNHRFVVRHPNHRWTRAEQIRFAMTHGRPLFPPGTDFHYSDTGYVLLGEILERQTGHSLARAYRRLLDFDRHGLHHTYLETLEPTPRRATPRAHQYLGTTDTTRFDPSFDLYGGGGLVSTVNDLARFYRALFAGQVFENPATLKTMLGKPHPTSPADLGMGIFTETIGHATCWHHDGFWGTTVVHCPGTRVTLAITVNQADNFDAAIHHLEAAVLRLVSRT